MTTFSLGNQQINPETDRQTKARRAKAWGQGYGFKAVKGGAIVKDSLIVCYQWWRLYDLYWRNIETERQMS